MPPRPYRMSRRQQAVDWRRAYMRAAARRVLRAPGSADFSLNAVARRAGVTRLTVYHQFGSRRGLLEALFDDLAARGGLYELPSAFREPHPETALERYIGFFWGVLSSPPPRRPPPPPPPPPRPGACAPPTRRPAR